MRESRNPARRALLVTTVLAVAAAALRPAGAATEEQLKELRDKVTALVDVRFGGDWDRAFRQYAAEVKPRRKLDHDELAALLLDAEIGDGTAAHPAVQAAVEHIDRRNPRRITWAEFREAFPAPSRWYRKFRKRLRKRIVRRRFDGDGAAAFAHYAALSAEGDDEELDRDELLALLEDIGIGNRITRGAWSSAILSELDTSGDDVLDGSEFMRVLGTPG